MNTAKPLSREAVLQLRRSVAARAADADARLADALRRPLGGASAIKEWHDLLLFVEAYPQSAAQHRLAVKGLRTLREALGARLQKDDRLREQLRDTGLHGCDMVGIYSFALARWLQRHWPGRLELHSADAPHDAALTSLLPLLAAAEREVVEQLGTDTDGLLRSAFGDDASARLMGLIRTITEHPMDDGLREAVFSSLQPYLNIIAEERSPSLTSLRVQLVEPFIHEQALERSADTARAISEPVGESLSLTAAEERQLIRKARMVLALMQRETDPITYAGHAEAFDMGRGLAIALYQPDAEHRLALESYVGFMAFKNGVPLAYGGAWVFPGRSKVGINVFPALRGGESAWFFAQLLRLYHQRFGVAVFEAENYQLGHGNADGLRSGAYWFYYRLGFRPWNDRLARIAAREFERVRAGKTVPLATSKELVADGLVLRLVDDTVPTIDTGALLRRAHHHLASRTGMSRRKALAVMRERLCDLLGIAPAELRTKDLLLALEAWAPLCDMITGLRTWHRKDLDAVADALRARAEGGERAYQLALRRCTKLLGAWAEMASADP